MSDPDMPPEEGSRSSTATLPSLASRASGWLRALFLVGLTAGLLSALGTEPAAGRPEPSQPGPSLQGSALTVQLDAVTPADSLNLEWRDPDDSRQVSSAPLTRAEERALEEEANLHIARLRAEREAEVARSAAVLAKLNSAIISLHFPGVPMDEAIDFLRDTTELNYVVGTRARSLIVEEDVTVSLVREEISLHNALTLILAAHEDLSFRVRDGLILIQTKAELPQLELAAFAVEDIVDGRLQGQGGASISSEVLVELFEGSLDLLSSVEFAEGPSGSRKGALVVRATPPELTKVRTSLRRLRTLEREPVPEPGWIAHYRAALTSRRVTFDFQGRPLPEVITFLQDRLGLSLTLCFYAEVDPLIELRLREVSIGDALRLILEQVGLVYSFSGETLVIHDPGNERYAHYEVEVLDVRDLLSWLTPDALECLVEEGVTGNIRIEWDPCESLQLHRGQLVLRQTRARTQEIRELLTRLRASHAESLRAARAR